MSNDSTVITSAQNQYVSLARSLEERKQRQKQRMYRMDGVKLFCEAVSRGIIPQMVLLKEGSEQAVFAKVEQLYGIEMCDVDCTRLAVAASVFDKLSEENAPEGIIAIMRYDDQKHRELDASQLCTDTDENVLIMESVRDPQNVGAILRAAAAFSVDRVIMSRDCADIYNSKAIRASMGALFSLKIDRVDSVLNTVERLKSSGRRVFGAALDYRAQRLGAFEIKCGDCVIIGNEGHGIDGATLGACTDSVYIPMSDGVESLNAATAAAVLAWEFFGKKL